MMTASLLPTAASVRAGARLTPRASGPRQALRVALRVSAFTDGERETESPPKTGSLIPAFTRRRERLVGRLAMLGVAAAWSGEVLTGLGPLTQLSNETGVPMGLVYATTAALAASQFLLGTSSASRTFDNDNQRDIARRTKGLTGVSEIEPDVSSKIDAASQPGKFFLRNELVLGRAAMLIFAGAAVAELVFGGRAPLAVAGLINPPSKLSQAPFYIQLAIALFFVGGTGIFSGFDTNKDPDTY